MCYPGCNTVRRYAPYACKGRYIPHIQYSAAKMVPRLFQVNCPRQRRRSSERVSLAGDRPRLVRADFTSHFQQPRDAQSPRADPSGIGRIVSLVFCPNVDEALEGLTLQEIAGDSFVWTLPVTSNNRVMPEPFELTPVGLDELCPLRLLPVVARTRYEYHPHRTFWGPTSNMPSGR